jgi:hypothetical protein
MNKSDLVKPLIDKALKNYYKPGVIEMLVDLFNDMNDNNNCPGDHIYINDSHTLDFALNNLTPSQVLGMVKKHNNYDAYFGFDGYGHLFSFHSDYVVGLLTNHHDFIDYIVNYVDIDTLNKLSDLADQDTNKILKAAYQGGAK